jgi:aspartyl-tRNA(Asn)/glutamyl-tRNA(Gln) amidotransferase subunit C
MQIDEATVRHVARLARIRVSAEETANLKRELTSILQWVEQLGEVDTSSVEPMTRVGEMKLPRRKDEVTAGEMPDAIVKNAPLTEDHYFLVPKVVE